MGFLEGKFLIATPKMTDPRFRHAIIILCEHDEDHTMGIVINKRIDKLSFGEIGEQLGIDEIADNYDSPIYEGGPCQPERGFVLHSSEWSDNSTLKVSNDISLTVSKDVIAAIAGNNGPKHSLIALGYAGWSGSQLEGELDENIWILTEADPELIFSNYNAQKKWQLSFSQINIDPARLSSHSGHA